MRFPSWWGIPGYVRTPVASRHHVTRFSNQTGGKTSSYTGRTGWAQPAWTCVAPHLVGSNAVELSAVGPDLMDDIKAVVDLLSGQGPGKNDVQGPERQIRGRVTSVVCGSVVAWGEPPWAVGGLVGEATNGMEVVSEACW